MAWVLRKNNRYYYRSIRRGRTVRRIYVGSNRQAAKPADEDDARRNQRLEAARMFRAHHTQRLRLEETVEQLHRATTDWADLVMALAGYHRHDRGGWRKRRAAASGRTPKPNRRRTANAARGRTIRKEHAINAKPAELATRALNTTQATGVQRRQMQLTSRDDLSLENDPRPIDSPSADGTAPAQHSLEPAPLRSLAPARTPARPAEPLDFKRLRDRVLRDDPTAREAVVRALAEAPTQAIRAFFGDLEFNVTALLINDLSSRSSLVSEAIQARLAQLRLELGAEGAGMFERVLIEDCVRSWLYLMAAEDEHYVSRPYGTPREREQSLALCDRAHRRFLSAMKTLAQVRKLALPNVQVNIAQKQVNVSGSVRVRRRG